MPDGEVDLGANERESLPRKVLSSIPRAVKGRSLIVLGLIPIAAVVVAPHGHAGEVQIQYVFEDDVPEMVRTVAEIAAGKWESWLRTPQLEPTVLQFQFRWQDSSVPNPPLASAGPSWFEAVNGFGVASTLYRSLGYPTPSEYEGEPDAAVVVWSDANPALLNDPNVLESILLHELGHAFGFAASYLVGDDVSLGEWGVVTPSLDLCISSFDRHLIDAATRRPVVGLADFDVLSPVRFDGPRTSRLLPGGAPIFSPPILRPGSSVHHLGMYALMWPRVGPFKGLHAFEVAILEDVGWQFNQPTELKIVEARSFRMRSGDDDAEVPPSWHQGDQWGGLPPSANTHVSLKAGDNDYCLPVTDALAEAASLLIVGSPSSEPRLLLESEIRVGGDISIGVIENSTGAMDVMGAAFVTGDLRVGGGNSAEARFSVAEGYADVVGSLNVGNGGETIVENSAVQVGAVLVSGSTQSSASLTIQNSFAAIDGDLLVEPGGSLTVEDGFVRAANFSQDGGDSDIRNSRLEVSNVSFLDGFRLLDGVSVGSGGEEGATLRLGGGGLGLSDYLHVDGKFELAGGNILVASGDVSVSSSSGDASSWDGTSISGIGLASRLMVNPAELRIGEGVRILTDVEVEVSSRTVAAGGTFSLEDASLVFNGMTSLHGDCLLMEGSHLQFNGDVVYEGRIDLEQGSAFNLQGRMILSGEGVIADGSSSLQVGGAITKRGEEVTVLDGPILINGHVAVEEGCLRISGPGSLGGICQIAEGATFELGSTFSATVIENEGTVRRAGNYENAHRVTLGARSVFETVNFVQGPGGLIEGTGVLRANAELSGQIEPGLSPGILTIAGNAVLREDAILSLGLGEPGGSNDRLSVVDPDSSDGELGGDLSLDGTLEIVPLPGFREGVYVLASFEGALINHGLEVTGLPPNHTASIRIEGGEVLLHVAAANLATWAAGFGLEGQDSLPDAIPFRDGVPNLLKYAFNMTGDGPSRTVLQEGGIMGLPLVSVAEGLDRQPRLKVQYLRRRALGLNYEVHVSGDLESFGPMGGDESIEPINEVWERVTLLESEPSSISSSRFARVQVTAD